MSRLTVGESFDVVIYDNSIQYLLRFEEWEAVSGQGKSARPTLLSDCLHFVCRKERTLRLRPVEERLLA